MKLFDGDATLPKYYVNHKKLHDALLPLLSLIVCPIISILMFACSDANLVSTSISKLGWQNNMLAVVYIWGIVNIALIGYGLKLVLDTGSYSKTAKTMLYTLMGLGCVIILVGISVPFISDDSYQHFVMRKIHNVFATVGFVMFVVTLITLTAMTFARNKLQAFIGSAAIGFLIITGIFAVVEVNSPERITFITASAQMYIFAMLHVLLCVQFFLNKFLPIDKSASTQSTDNPSADPPSDAIVNTDVE